MLQQDVVEFAPYVFQLLSQMIEMHPGPLPPAYMAIFPALLAPTLWERQANVTPLVRLLEAYLRVAPAEVAGGGHLSGILGVFQKLASSRAQDHQGFFILNAFVECLDLRAWADNLPACVGDPLLASAVEQDGQIRQVLGGVHVALVRQARRRGGV